MKSRAANKLASHDEDRFAAVSAPGLRRKDLQTFRRGKHHAIMTRPLCPNPQAAK